MPRWSRWCGLATAIPGRFEDLTLRYAKAARHTTQADTVHMESPGLGDEERAWRHGVDVGRGLAGDLAQDSAQPLRSGTITG